MNDEEQLRELERLQAEREKQAREEAELEKQRQEEEQRIRKYEEQGFSPSIAAITRELEE